jgi:hypothetical protein
MQYKIRPSRFTGEWVVEAVDEKGDGALYVAAFSGLLAEERAVEYVVLKQAAARQNVAAA